MRIRPVNMTAWGAACLAAVGCADAPAPVSGPSKVSTPAKTFDLVASMVDVPDTVATSIDRVTITVDYTNLGDSVIPAGWEATFSAISDVGDSTVIKAITFDRQLEPGETITRNEIIVPFPVASGLGAINLTVDVSDSIPESSETNNFDRRDVAYTFGGGYGQVWTLLSDDVADTLALVRFESNPFDAMLLSVIPDTAGSGSSPVNPTLSLASATNGTVGGDRDDLNLMLNDPSEPQLGVRSIAGGEMMAIRAGPVAERNQIFVGTGGGTAGRAQLIIQNCFRMDAVPGSVLVDSLIESDCMLWPNPVSGQRSRAILVGLSAEAGDDVTMSLESVDFNGVLLTFGPDGSLLAVDDDGGAGTDATIQLPVSESGNYMVVITSHDLASAGEWALTVSGGSAVSGRGGAHRTRSHRRSRPLMKFARR